MPTLSRLVLEFISCEQCLAKFPFTGHFRFFLMVSLIARGTKCEGIPPLLNLNEIIKIYIYKQPKFPSVHTPPSSLKTQCDEKCQHFLFFIFYERRRKLNFYV